MAISFTCKPQFKTTQNLAKIFVCRISIPLHPQKSGAARVFCKFDAAADERHFIFVNSIRPLWWPAAFSLAAHFAMIICALGATNTGSKYPPSKLSNYCHLLSVIKQQCRLLSRQALSLAVDQTCLWPRPTFAVAHTCITMTNH